METEQVEKLIFKRVDETKLPAPLNKCLKDIISMQVSEIFKLITHWEAEYLKTQTK